MAEFEAGRSSQTMTTNRTPIILKSHHYGLHLLSMFPPLLRVIVGFRISQGTQLVRLCPIIHEEQSQITRNERRPMVLRCICRMTHSALRPTMRKSSELVNVDFAIIRELERATLVIFTKGIFVDLGIFRQLAVGLQISGLVCSVFDN